MPLGRVVIAGASGGIGSALARYLISKDCQVVGLSRKLRAQQGALEWQTWDGGDPGALRPIIDGAHAVINLCGSPVFAKWTPESQEEMRRSRISPTRAIGEAISQCERPPNVWINASAVGIYGDCRDGVFTEEDAGEDGFLVELSREWESCVWERETPATRRIVLRLGIVLSREFGMYPELRKLSRRFLGSAIGNGDHWISWIHVEDLLRLFEFGLEKELSGTFNAVAPESARNRSFMAELRRACHRPWVPPVPLSVAKIVARAKGLEPTMLNFGQSCSAAKIQAAGFEFRYKTISEAIRNLAEKK